MEHIPTVTEFAWYVPLYDDMPIDVVEFSNSAIRVITRKELMEYLYRNGPNPYIY